MMRRVWLALCLALAMSTPVLAEEAPLDIALPHPGSAFFLSLPAPGGGQFFLGEPLKGSLYLGGGLAGAVLGYMSFDWIPPGRSPTPNEVENLEAIGYGLVGYLLVGILSGIDASMTAAGRHANVETLLETPETPQPKKAAE